MTEVLNVSERLLGLLPSITVRIVFKNLQGFATGFYVAPRQVVTCSQVLRKAGPSSIEMTLAGSSAKISASFQKRDLHNDITCIEVEEVSQNQICAYLDFEKEPKSDDSLYVYGYSDEDPDGNLLSVAIESHKGVKYIVATSKDKRIRPGHSGAPILNLRSGKICGMIRYINSGCGVYSGEVISINSFLEAIPSLISLQEKFHDFNMDWRDAILSNSSIAASDNLPTQVYKEFLGREQELGAISEFLSPKVRAWILSIVGIGGIGKTALAIEAARRCSQANERIFDSIIFASAKQSYFRFQRMEKPKNSGETKLSDLFRVIAEVLDDQSIMKAPTKTQIEKIRNCFKKKRALLIIDNLETFDGSTQEHPELMNFLDLLPEGSKAILTSRVTSGIHRHLKLEGLSQDSSVKLAKYYAGEHRLELSDQEAVEIYDSVKGIPLAIINAVSLKSNNYDLINITREKSDSDLMDFIFAEVVNLLSAGARKLFKSFAVFNKAPTRRALAHVSGLGEVLLDDYIQELVKYSLVTVTCEQEQDQERYYIISITRRYSLRALEECEKDGDFARKARARWIGYYKKFSKDHGNKDQDDWGIKYTKLREEHDNIHGVFRWCYDQDRHNDIIDLWNNLENYLDVCGYWEERLEILNYLIPEAKRSGNRKILARAYASIGWTMTLQGGPKQETAKAYLDLALELKNELDESNRARLINHFAVYSLTVNNLSDAILWLKEEETVAQRIRSNKEKERALARMNYYKGEVEFRKGNYSAAHLLFENARDRARRIGWLRFVNYSNNWLAEIYTLEGKKDLARQILREGLEEAKQNSEQRRIAHFQATFARLEYSLKNYNEARDFGEKALTIFKRENILDDAKKMQDMMDCIDKGNGQELKKK